MSTSGTTDPLVHHGRHFGRTVHALCNVSSLLNNGILRMGELSERSEDTFSHEYTLSPHICMKNSFIPTRERREHRIFKHLLRMVPGLEDRVMEGSDEDFVHIAELV